MRRVFFVCLIFFLLPLASSAWMGPLLGSGGGQSAALSCAETASGNYGKTYEDGTSSNASQYRIFLLKIDLGAAEGSDPTIYCYLADDSSDGQVKFVIYDDDGGSGEPGTRLYVSSSSTAVDSSSFAWKSESTSTTCLTGVVWAGFIAGNAMNPGYQYKLSDGVVRYISNGNYDPPAAWNTDGDTHSTASCNFYLAW